MNVASLELSRTLYEVSGWGDKALGQGRWDFAGPQEDMPPAYDLGYLLRKLGEAANDYRMAVFTNDGKRWIANRTTANTVEQQCEADTPEDAACKLAIELFKQKVLNKENS